MTRVRSKPYRKPDEELVTIAWTAPYPAGQPTHRQLVEMWIETAHALGYRVTVMHDSRGEHWGADSGWPDIVAVRGGCAYAIEVKVPPDTLTDEQRSWLTELGKVPGITEGVFRSSGDRARDQAVVADILREQPPVLPR